MQVIKWNQVCASVHEVMKEILLGLEMGSINQETYNRYEINVLLIIVYVLYNLIIIIHSVSQRSHFFVVIFY